MIGVKVDKNNTSNKTVQKKANGTAEAKSKSAPAVAQLCGCGDKNNKSEGESSTSKTSFWSPETIQGKFEGGIKQLKSAPSFPPIQLNDSNSNPAESVSTLENKTGLPDDVKTNTEKLSGVSLNDVKVHYNSSAPAQLHAHAYAQGTDIHVGPGQEKHVPHEAWHVVQQKQGRVKATTQMKGMVPVNDDAGLEKEADVMGAKAVQMVAMEEEAPVQQKAIGNNGGVAQLGMWSWIKEKMGVGDKKKEEDERKKDISNEGEALRKGEKNVKSLGQRGMLALNSAGKAGGKVASVAEKASDVISDKANKVGGNLAMESAIIGILGVDSSIKIAKSGMEGSGNLTSKGVSKSLGLAGDGILASAEAAGAGLEASAEASEFSPALGLAGAGISIAGGIAGAGISTGIGVAGAGISTGIGIAGGGLSVAGGIAGASVSTGIGLTGMATGGALALGGNIIGKGLEVAGGALGLATSIGVGIGEGLFQLDEYINDALENVPMSQVLKLTEGLSTNFDQNTITQSYIKSSENQGVTNIAKSVFYGGKNNDKGDEDTHASKQEGKTNKSLALSGSILSPVGDAHEVLKGNESAETMSSVIGDLLVGAVATFNSISSLYNIFTSEQSTNKYSEIKKLGYNLTVATKAGFKAATDIQKYIDGTVGPLKSALPGLSLAVAVCDTLMSIHRWREASEVEEALTGGKEAERAKKEPIIVDWNNVSSNLIAASNGEPWTSNLFIEDVRGKRSITDFFGADPGGEWSNLNKYKRVDSKYYSTIVAFANGIQPNTSNTDHKATLDLLKPLVKGENESDIVNYCKLLTNYQLVSKLHEINNKRRVHGARETGANIISTAGAIMQLVPVDGGSAAAILTGTGAGIKFGLTAGKWLKRFANDGKFGKTLQGEDGERKSSNQKSKEYFEHALTILNNFKDLHPTNPNMIEFLKLTEVKNAKDSREDLINTGKVSEGEIHNWATLHVNANQLLTATGVDKHDFYYRVKNYNSNSIASFAEFIATKLGDGR